MVNSFPVVFVIIGTLIGAGFASGQEVYTFFFSPIHLSSPPTKPKRARGLGG